MRDSDITKGSSLRGFKRTAIITSDSLIEAGFPLTADYLKGIYSLASRLSKMYGKAHLEEDFQQSAVLVATLKESKYDSTRGASFYTFVAPSIQATLFQQFGTVKQHSSLYKKLEVFTRQFEETHNYYPDTLQMSEALNVPLWKIKSIYVNDIPMEIPLEPSVSSQDIINSDTFNLDEVLQNLSNLERTVVTKHLIDGIPLNEIASSSGISTWVLDEALGKAISKLEPILIDYV